jgi:hypothetical protein
VTDRRAEEELLLEEEDGFEEEDEEDEGLDVEDDEDDGLEEDDADGIDAGKTGGAFGVDAEGSLTLVYSSSMNRRNPSKARKPIA